MKKKDILNTVFILSPSWFHLETSNNFLALLYSLKAQVRVELYI